MHNQFRGQTRIRPGNFGTIPNFIFPIFSSIFWNWTKNLIDRIQFAFVSVQNKSFTDKIEIPFRQFLSIALRIPTAYDFRFISARTWARALTKRKRFPSNCAFAKNSLINNLFEGKKVVEHDFLEEIVSSWVYFGQGEDFKLSTELSEKLQYSCKPAIRNSLNEAINIWLCVFLVTKT